MTKPLPSNPFPGLRSYRADEAGLFFGREQQVQDLLSKMDAYHFLTLVGTSGSGRSSLVRCGLLPALKKGQLRHQTTWSMIDFHPGEDPIGNLLKCFNNLLDLDISKEALISGQCSIASFVHKVEEHLSKDLVIFTDQFEELFRFKHQIQRMGSVDEAYVFVALLLALAKASSKRIYIVLTLRTDFLENCTPFPGLIETINQSIYITPRLTETQWRRVTQGPCESQGVSLSKNLEDRIIRELGNDYDQLPILQHALMRTWNYWVTDHFDNEGLEERHYDAIGGMEEAISRHAEEAYAQLKTEPEKVAIAKIFKALTERGKKGKGIRRPCSLGDLCQILEQDQDLVCQVMAPFRQQGCTFLVPPIEETLTADSMIDISHESLMRLWPRLNHWVMEEAQAARIYIRLAKDAEDHQEGSTGLWSDPELGLALKWKDKNKPTAPWALRYDTSFERAMVFLEESRRERDRFIAQNESQQRKRMKHARYTILSFGVLIVLLMGFALYGLIATRNARQKADAALHAEAQMNLALAEAKKQEKIAQEKATEAKTNLDQALKNEKIAKINEQEAIKNAEIADRNAREVREKNRQILQARKDIQSKDEDIRRQQALTKEQRALADAASEVANLNKKRADQSEAKARDLLELELARELLRLGKSLMSQNPSLAVFCVSVAHQMGSNHPGFLKSEALNESLRASMNIMGLNLDRGFYSHGTAVTALAKNPKAPFLVTGDQAGKIYMLNDNSEEHRKVSREVSDAITYLSFNNNGKALAAGATNGQIHLWSPELPGDPFKKLTAHKAAIRSFDFMENRYLASADMLGNLKLWFLSEEKPHVLAFDQFPNVTHVDFHPDLDLLAISGQNGVVVLRDLENELGPMQIVMSKQPSGFVKFSHDGNWLASTDQTGLIYVWAVNKNKNPISFQGHLATVNHLNFSKDSGLLASASDDHTVRLWFVEDPSREPLILRGHTDKVNAVAIDSQREFVWSSSNDQSLRRWIIDSEQMAEFICIQINDLPDFESWYRDLEPLIESVWRTPTAKGLMKQAFRQSCPVINQEN